MGAYRNALREEGSREDLLKALEKAWAEIDKLRQLHNRRLWSDDDRKAMDIVHKAAKRIVSDNSSAVSQWQPIETALKIEPILVPEIRGRYCIPRACIWTRDPLLGNLSSCAWRLIDDPQGAVNPTCWMPLPESPTPEGE